MKDTTIKNITAEEAIMKVNQYGSINLLGGNKIEENTVTGISSGGHIIYSNSNVNIANTRIASNSATELILVGENSKLVFGDGNIISNNTLKQRLMRT